MSSTIIECAPRESTKIIEKVDITSVVVNLFTDAKINVVMRDINGVYIDNRELSMSKEEYLQWMNDDTFIVEWVLKQLDLTKK